MSRMNRAPTVSARYYQPDPASHRLGLRTERAPWPRPAAASAEEWRRQSFLGIAVQPIAEALLGVFGATAGVLVVAVQRHGPAHKAGLAVGDVLTRMDRKSIRQPTDVQRVLNHLDPGETADLEIIRAGRKRCSVRLGDAPEQAGSTSNWV